MMAKLPFWADPNDSVTILEATGKAAGEYGHGYGSDLIKLQPKHIEALLRGKMLAWNDSEYSTFVVFEKAVKEKAGSQAKIHWHGCWRVHLDCAVARVQELERTGRGVVAQFEESQRRGYFTYDLTQAVGKLAEVLGKEGEQGGHSGNLP
jgi:hypothetical protein